MLGILEKIFDLLRGAWIYLLPFYVLGDDQCGLVRRVGIYHRDLRPGLNWKWPVIEQVLVETSTLDSTVLREQTLTTKDGKQVTIRACIAYRVVNPRKYILDCDSAASVINDVGCCVVAELIPEVDLEHVLTGSIEYDLLQAMRSRARKWGVKVESVGLVDRVQTRTYRLLTGSSGAGV